VVLNYLKRRDKDHSTARVRRFRERQAAAARAAALKAAETGNGVFTVS